MAVSTKWFNNVVIMVDNLVLDSQSVGWSIDTSGDSPVNTVTEGFGGMVKSTRTTKINVSVACPRDMDTWSYIEKAANELNIVEVVLMAGDKQLKTKGFIQNPSAEWSMDSPLTGSFEVIADPKSLK